MARVKRGVTAKARHKKVLGKAKGYYGARSKLFKTAKQAVIKAGQYAYRDRRQRGADRLPARIRSRRDSSAVALSCWTRWRLFDSVGSAFRSKS